MAGVVMNLDTTHLLALAAALGWASGLRLYAVVFLTGLAGHLGWVSLPTGLKLLEQPAMLWASGALLVVEFVADKVPWVDSLWDSVHTFIRVPAGAALAFSVFGGDQGTWAAAAALLGGTLAATSHAAKTTTRAAVNTSPEPFSNLALSLAGDAFVPAMLWLAWEHPVWFALALALTLAVSVVLIVVLFRFLRGLARRLRGHFQPTAVGEH
jgi:Domain of unknown function (DUF4126)